MTIPRRVLAILLVLLFATTATAAPTPDSTFIVVNPESWASVTVANHYVQARNIPDPNILFLPFKLERKPSGGDDQATIETFREKLLKPVLDAIKQRGLEKQIDCIAWSSDFPTAIDFSADVPPPTTARNPATRQRGGPGFHVGSINGLTFLYEQVLAKDAAAYSSLKANHYYRAHKQTGENIDVEPPVPFSSQTAYAGRKHMLSIVLGVTSGRGNSVSEVAAGFTRATAADFSNPRGTFYYSVNDNIRSRTRQWAFDPAIAKLQEIGAKGERNKDTFPKNKNDILGAMLGLIHPKQDEAHSQTLPGAIVENLTSEGGIMNWGANQTPLSSFIRHGAAGSSGTVIEPYAIQAKFPTPFLFYHYAKGATLVEAYHQSVQGPYQLLIVGDPMCQPFGKRPAAPATRGVASGKPLFEKSILLGPAYLPAFAVEIPEGKVLVAGPLLTSAMGSHVVEDMRRKMALQEAKVPVGGDYGIEAYFDAAADDVYQFQIFTDGKAALKVDNTAIGESVEKTWTFLPVALAKGKHKLEVKGLAGPTRELTIRFGGPGSRDIGKRTRDFDLEHPALHFSHVGVPTPAAATAPAVPAKP